MPSKPHPSPARADYEAEFELVRTEQAHIASNDFKRAEGAAELATIKSTGDPEDPITTNRALVLSIKDPMYFADTERRQAKLVERFAYLTRLQNPLRADHEARINRATGDFTDALESILPKAWFTDHTFFELGAGSGHPEAVDFRREGLLGRIFNESDFGLRLNWLKQYGPSEKIQDAGAAQAVLVWANAAERLIADLERHTKKFATAA